MHTEDLVTITSTLANTPPPSSLRMGDPGNPQPLFSGASPCRACAAIKETYEDAPPPTTAPPPAAPAGKGDELLFADDDFTLGDPGATPLPYADPAKAPGGTAFSGKQNILGGVGVPAPTEFQKAVGADALAIGSTNTFSPAPAGPATPPPIATTKTSYEKWMPMGLSNTQALFLAIAVCTACLLLFFIVGMNSPSTQPVDPLLATL